MGNSVNHFITRYFSDQYYTAWMYDMLVPPQEPLPIKLPKASAVILYNLKGKAVLHSGHGHTLHLYEQSYSMLSLQPDHHMLMIGPDHSRVFFLLFHPPSAFLQDETAFIIEHPDQDHVSSINNICQQLIEDIYRNEQHHHSEIWRLKRQVLILDLLFKSMDEIGVYYRKEQPNVQHRDYEKIRMVKEYIRENIDKKLSIQQLAGRFNILPTQLRRGYQQVYKQGLTKYIQEERLRRAKRLLYETELPVHEIAWEVGYESAAGFTRVFHLFFQQSPTDFRRFSRNAS